MLFHGGWSMWTSVDIWIQWKSKTCRHLRKRCPGWGNLSAKAVRQECEESLRSCVGQDGWNRWRRKTGIREVRAEAAERQTMQGSEMLNKAGFYSKRRRPWRVSAKVRHKLMFQRISLETKFVPSSIQDTGCRNVHSSLVSPKGKEDEVQCPKAVW